MPIVSSTQQVGAPQADGRLWVVERHTDSQGQVYDRSWLAQPTDDRAAALAAYATQLATNLAAAETEANLTRIKTDGATATVTTLWATLSGVRSALRTAYLTATRTEAVMIGDFLAALTDAQLQTLFGMTAAQVTTLRSNKLTPAATLASSIRAAAGQ